MCYIYHRTAGTATTLQDAAISTVDEAASAGALKWNTACCYLPHPEKLHYGGEDAHFISGVGGGACGVACMTAVEIQPCAGPRDPGAPWLVGDRRLGPLLPRRHPPLLLPLATLTEGKKNVRKRPAAPCRGRTVFSLDKMGPGPGPT